jgi:hypothetical protein
MAAAGFERADGRDRRGLERTLLSEHIKSLKRDACPVTTVQARREWRRRTTPDQLICEVSEPDGPTFDV